MESNEYASKGVGTAGLTLGIIGTALASGIGGGNGILGNLFNGGSNQQIATLTSEIAKLQSERYTDNAILAQRDREFSFNKDIADFSISIEKRLSILEATAPLREQLISQQIGTLSNSVMALANQVCNITKTVVPINAVCPQPMPQYNSWVAPTTVTAPTTTAANA